MVGSCFVIVCARMNNARTDRNLNNYRVNTP